MYRVKQLLGASLRLQNDNAQVGETYAMIKALNKLTGIGMPETQYVVWNMNDLASVRSYAELDNKAVYWLLSVCIYNRKSLRTHPFGDRFLTRVQK